MKLNNHGDLILKPISKVNIPKSANKLKIHVLQDSLTTGNRHEVVTEKGFIYHWIKDEKEYLHCNTDFTIRHVGGDCEHGEQLVEKGTKEVLHEIEYDPWKNELKVVID